MLRAKETDADIREVRALDDISFDISAKERVGIIGANGAGKTTLLSILAGLTDATSGEVSVNGDIHAMLSIGAVLREDLTGRENVYLDASMHGRSQQDIDRVASSIVEFSELGEFIDRPVRTYSSGMKARIAFSMGAFIDPDIFVLDETLSVGDAFFSKKASARMREIAMRGSIVVVVSHALKTIVELCTRCIWLDGGRIVMDGDPKAVVGAYEMAVRQTDAADLRRKFGTNSFRESLPGGPRITDLAVVQEGEARASTLAALQPSRFEIKGVIDQSRENLDLNLRLFRVDGREIWKRRLSSEGISLPRLGAFTLSVKMAPFVLGADLYRVDAELRDDADIYDRKSKVFEVVDDEGQYGGQPLLFYPVKVTSKRIG
ncbi:MAG: ABC transporter ATP-binding protein [Bacteroidota bacterium]|nr:ABC transporter ATP-binding protein [Bacteroidota bacterium]